MLYRKRVGNAYVMHLYNDTSAFVQRICASIITSVKKSPPLALNTSTSTRDKKCIYKPKVEYKVECMEKHQLN